MINIFTPTALLAILIAGSGAQQCPATNQTTVPMDLDFDYFQTNPMYSSNLQFFRYLTVPCDGTLVQWLLVPQTRTVSNLHMAVFRERGNSLIFDIVGQSYIRSKTWPAEVVGNWVFFPLIRPIEVQKGDVLGFYYDSLDISQPYLTISTERVAEPTFSDSIDFKHIAYSLRLATANVAKGSVDASYAIERFMTVAMGAIVINSGNAMLTVGTQPSSTPKPTSPALVNYPLPRGLSTAIIDTTTSSVATKASASSNTRRKSTAKASTTTTWADVDVVFPRGPIMKPSGLQPINPNPTAQSKPILSVTTSNPKATTSPNIPALFPKGPGNEVPSTSKPMVLLPSNQNPVNQPKSTTTRTKASTTSLYVFPLFPRGPNSLSSPSVIQSTSTQSKSTMPKTTRTFTTTTSVDVSAQFPRGLNNQGVNKLFAMQDPDLNNSIAPSKSAKTSTSTTTSADRAALFPRGPSNQASTTKPAALQTLKTPNHSSNNRVALQALQPMNQNLSVQSTSTSKLDTTTLMDISAQFPRQAPAANKLFAIQNLDLNNSSVQSKSTATSTTTSASIVALLPSNQVPPAVLHALKPPVPLVNRATNNTVPLQPLKQVTPTAKLSPQQPVNQAPPAKPEALQAVNRIPLKALLPLGNAGNK